MAGSKVLLDTTIVAAYLIRETAVLEQFKKNTIFVPIVVIGELFYGAYHSEHIEKKPAPAS